MFRLTGLSLALLLSATSSLHAELPPGSYDNLRNQADEALIIQVESVQSQVRDEKREVTVVAKVLKVERSRAKLTKGNELTIKYEIFQGNAFAGPRQAKVLEQGEIYPAFLTGPDKPEDPFQLAAHGMSFTMTPEP